jgi:hypothetical protein
MKTLWTPAEAPKDQPVGDGAEDFLMHDGEGGVRVSGCLPRASAAGAFFPVVPMATPGAEPDAIELVPASEYATQESRRTYQQWTMDQNGYPACCLASLANAMQLLMMALFGKWFALDWRSVWKFLSGGRGGVALDVAAEYAARKGFPRLDGKGVVRISEAYDCPDAKSLASAAMRGCVGTFGHGGPRNGHAECWTRIVMQPGGKLFLDTVNSWGQWGEQGPTGFYGWHLFALSDVEIAAFGTIAIRMLTGDGLELGGDAQ